MSPPQAYAIDSRRKTIRVQLLAKVDLPPEDRPVPVDELHLEVRRRLRRDLEDERRRGIGGRLGHRRDGKDQLDPLAAGPDVVREDPTIDRPRVRADLGGPAGEVFFAQPARAYQPGEGGGEDPILLRDIVRPPDSSPPIRNSEGRSLITPAS